MSLFRGGRHQLPDCLATSWSLPQSRVTLGQRLDQTALAESRRPRLRVTAGAPGAGLAGLMPSALVWLPCGFSCGFFVAVCVTGLSGYMLRGSRVLPSSLVFIPAVSDCSDTQRPSWGCHQGKSQQSVPPQPVPCLLPAPSSPALSERKPATARQELLRLWVSPVPGSAGSLGGCCIFLTCRSFLHHPGVLCSPRQLYAQGSSV